MKTLIQGKFYLVKVPNVICMSGYMILQYSGSELTCELSNYTFHYQDKTIKVIQQLPNN